MQINYKSSINEVVQALSGKWDVSVSNDWKVVELGKVRIFKKLVDGASPLPDSFIERRTEITPYIVFHKDTIEGGVITLQDTAITADGLVIILQF